MWYDPVVTPEIPTDCQCCDCDDMTPGLSLYEWGKYLCVSPFYLFQMSQNPNTYPKTPIPGYYEDSLCNQLVYQNCINSCSIAGREEICDAILTAELNFRTFAGFPSTPIGLCQEVSFPFKRKFRRGTITLPFGKLLALGRVKEVIVAFINLVDDDFKDLDGDGVIDTAVFKIAKDSVFRDKDEVVIKRVASPCRVGECTLKTEPICVRDDSLDNTIWWVEVPAQLLVRPLLFESGKPIDPNDLSVYDRGIGIHRKYVDGNEAITVYRNPQGNCTCKVDGPCYECDTIEGCIVDAENGIIRLDIGGNCCQGCAERLCIHYVAGECSGRYHRLVARLAAATLGRDICCSNVGTEVRYWSEDFVGVSERGRQVTTLSAVEMANFFGTRRGMVEAYRLLKRQKRYVSTWI